MGSGTGSTSALTTSSPRHSGSSSDTVARIAIIGGGVTGGGVFSQVVEDYIQRLKDDTGLPALQIDFFEAGGQYGYGTPYDLGYPVFRLNQPAYNMSLFDQYPSDFLDWLRSYEESKNIQDIAAARETVQTLSAEGLSDSQIAYRDPEAYYLANGWGHDDFVPRAFYRMYLIDRYDRAVGRAEEINAQLGRQAISITAHDMYVDTLEDQAEGTITVSGKNRTADARTATRADSVVLATGHTQNRLFADFRGHPTYGDTPFDMAEIARIAESHRDSGDPVFIMGTSQSMLDVLAGLDAVGYEGEIIAASSTAVEPWAFVPSLHRERRTDFEFRHITDANIRALIEKHGGDVERITDGVRQLLCDELHDPCTMDQGGGHVITSLKARAAIWRELMGTCPGLYERCFDLIGKFAGNSTFRERYETYRQYVDSGRLKIVRGRVNIRETAARPEGGFTVVLDDRVTGEKRTLQAASFFNCAAMERRPFRIDRESGAAVATHPLAQKALAQEMIVANPETDMLEPHPDRPAGQVNIAGPAKGGSWGVPYTRDGFGSSAREALSHALDSARGRAAELSL